METWGAIRSRRNVRAFADRPIADEDLDRILEAAWRTPSSSNQQRWDFMVCTDREQLEALSKVWQWATHQFGIRSSPGASSAFPRTGPAPG
jgi:nitroreductase